MWVLFLKTTSQPFADQPPFPALRKYNDYSDDITTSFCVCVSVCVCVYSQYSVVPEHTDGFGALLGGDQAKLHGDGFVQRVLQQLIVVVHGDTDHRCVDDRTLWYSDKNTSPLFKNE